MPFYLQLLDASRGEEALQPTKKERERCRRREIKGREKG